MKKKLIIGLIIVVVIVAIAFYFYKKNKKAKEQAALASENIPAPVGGTKSSIAPAAVTPTQVPQTNPNPAAKVFNFVTVVRDGTRGKAILMYQPLVDKFNVGDSVKILSGPYAGTHRIWNIYNFQSGGLVAGAGQNLYLETNFTVADKGTFSKA